LSAGLAVGEVAGWGWCGVAASQGGLVAARGDMDSEAAVRAGLAGDLPETFMPDDGLTRAGLVHLSAVLLGETRELPRLDARGTDFEAQVWEVLGTVRRGHTISYGKITERLGLDAGSTRAVGSDGSLTGYAGGLNLKRKLLNSEAMALLPMAVSSD
jgi:methylated-DNA-[protein]-cysteine S-methyltransferase